MMRKEIYLFALFFLGLISSLIGQENKVNLEGIVRNDSIELENVHILNLSSGLGAISNSRGEFRIPIALNDTIAVSSIQYHTVGLVINESLMKDAFIEFVLIPKIIELSEIELKGHDLKGMIYLDSKALSDSLSVIAARALDFNDLGLDDPTRMNYIVPKANLLNLIELIEDKKELKEQLEAQYQKSREQAADNIRAEMGDDFFVNELGIPISHIDDFISSCEYKNIVDLYLEERKIEVIDLMINEAPIYKKKNQMTN